MSENNGKVKKTSDPTSLDGQLDEQEDLIKRLLNKTGRLQQRDFEPDLQLQIALLIDLLARNREGFVYTHKVYFEAVFDLLDAEKPNFVLVQRLVTNLMVAEIQLEGGLAGLIYKLCGPRPVTAMVAGLVSIFAGFCFLLLLMFISHTVLHRLGQAIDSIKPILQLMDKLPPAHLLILLCSSFLGSVVSVITRIGVIEASCYRPLRIFIGVLFRPLISLAFALFIYAILQTGMVSFLGLSFKGGKGIAALWAVGFLAGYSERFAKDFISETETKMEL